MLRNNDADNVVDLTEYDIERLARSVGVLRYQAPINSCAYPGCGMPCAGVFCLDHATM
jgi:hypothetical protein